MAELSNKKELMKHRVGSQVMELKMLNDKYNKLKRDLEDQIFKNEALE